MSIGLDGEAEAFIGVIMRYIMYLLMFLCCVSMVFHMLLALGLLCGVAVPIAGVRMMGDMGVSVAGMRMAWGVLISNRMTVGELILGYHSWNTKQCLGNL